MAAMAGRRDRLGTQALLRDHLMMHRCRYLLVSLLVAAGVTAQAANLRVASGFDPQTLDPHALALLYHTRVHTQIYESLVYRDEQYRLEPGLALSWQALDAK